MECHRCFHLSLQKLGPHNCTCQTRDPRKLAKLLFYYFFIITVQARTSFVNILDQSRPFINT